jgi:hypothetical protein
VDLQAIFYRRRDKVEEREHPEDRDEHVVVDYRRIAGFRIGDDVADEREDEQGPEKLDTRINTHSWGHCCRMPTCSPLKVILMIFDILACVLTAASNLLNDWMRCFAST